jgi:hypothetical protein
MLTIYASLAQEVSESRSYNISWGIRHNFANGTSKFLNRACYGYRTKNDQLVICPAEAEVVKQIFGWRSEGTSLRTISYRLQQLGIKAPRGGLIWGPETLRKLLENEKYSGNVILQKTYIADYFSGKQAVNHGQLPRYLINRNNPTII